MNKIVNLIKCIDKYTQLIKPLTDKYKDVDRQKDLKLFINIMFLERFYYNSLSIKSLLELFQKDKNFKFPLGLLLRTGLSDFLTYFYFLLIVKENYPNDDLISLEIKRFLSGNIHYLQKEVEWNLSERKITKEQRDQIVQNIKKLYNDYFDLTTGKLIDNKNIAFANIKKELEKHDEFKWAAFAYKAYDVFSKYEHVGALTYDLQKTHLKNIDFDTNGIIWSTIHIYWGVERIINTMPEYMELKTSFDELNHDLLNL